MRVVFLAAGAGGMYCGSCLRDNRVVATLAAQGRDVVLIPLYTPIRTDESNVSESSVYYGGINVYLQQKSALFRHLPRWIERLLDAPSLLRRAMRFSGAVRPDDIAALTLSVLKGQQGAQRKELVRLIDGLRDFNPDVVVLPNLMFVGLAQSIRQELGVSVLCTLSGEDIFLDRLSEKPRDEAFALIRDRAQYVDAFVAVTEYFAEHATAHFSLPADRVHVVPLGVNVDDAANSSGSPARPFAIGYLARVCEEKGLEVLCDALIALRAAGRECRVCAAGYLAPTDRRYLDRIRAKLKAAGSADAFEYVGEVDRAGKLNFLRSQHVFSVPTLYREAKGLYVLEAMAYGLPVVQPRHGSFPELVGATGGGLLYDPTKPNALADALAKLMDDEALRIRLGAKGRAGVSLLYNDKLMADRTWALCCRIHDGERKKAR